MTKPYAAQPLGQGSLSPCSEWWQNRRIARHKNLQTNRGRTKLGRERETHFITPIQDSPMSQSNIGNQFDMASPSSERQLLPRRPPFSSVPQELTTSLLTTTATNPRLVHDGKGNDAVQVALSCNDQHDLPFLQSKVTRPRQNVPLLEPPRIVTTTTDRRITNDRTETHPVVVTPTTPKTRCDNDVRKADGFNNHHDNCSFIDDYW